MIRRLLSNFDIRVTFRPHATLRKILVSPKDSIPVEKKANVVYQIPCTSCSEVYIGQTSRTLGTRLREHKVSVERGDTQISAVAEHVWEKHHQIDWKNCSVLTREGNLSQRCYLESWFIQNNHTMNRESGTLPTIYCSLLD